MGDEADSIYEEAMLNELDDMYIENRMRFHANNVFRDANGIAYWTKRDMQRIKISDMTRQHIENVLKMFGVYMRKENYDLFMEEVKK